ncbi:hypothetical protein GCM10011309_23420 [Litorimonas cladophorae]|uniref:Inner membrane protein n=1 Tax=Litorimonas cladophorae TaxID=1220491 RepID=A0A918NJI0_9PROT|nr:hypothetical protein [Litorimonas cladophorae]GGX72402.1 hypothetical protein GCM10011309_23420 [Litorimonas cladophorae]
MNYEDMITKDGEPAGGKKVAAGDAHVAAAVSPDAVADAFDEATTPAKTPKPWKAVILTGFLASLIGGGLGAFGIYAGLKAQAPEAAPDFSAELMAATRPLSETVAILERRLAGLETDIGDMDAASLTLAEPVDLSTIETRLTTLETTAPSEIDPATIAALNAAQADGFKWPDTSALQARVTALETELLKLSEVPASEMPSDFPVGLTERLEALEAQITQSSSTEDLSVMMSNVLETIEARVSALENVEPIAPRVERIAVLAFPKEALLKAVEANAEGGFVKKTLSRHVRVKDDDNPRTLIDQIEVDISEGRLDAAANKFERLPAPVKTAGQAWYESVKASL